MKKKNLFYYLHILQLFLLLFDTENHYLKI